MSDRYYEFGVVDEMGMRMPAKKNRPKHRGAHYVGRGGIEPIDLIRAFDMGFCQGNVVKYVSRYKLKDGMGDLLKARQYLDWLIEDVENEHE